MGNGIKSQLKQYNQIYKSMDIVYHKYAKRVGLSDAAFWILYSVAESGREFTQRELSSEWSFPPQTVNSSLKDLVGKGIIKLEPLENNRKNKIIKLTDEGRAFIDRYVSPLIRAECDSFDALSSDECEGMLSSTVKYAAALKRCVEQIEIVETDDASSELGDNNA